MLCVAAHVATLTIAPTIQIKMVHPARHTTSKLMPIVTAPGTFTIVPHTSLGSLAGRTRNASLKRQSVTASLGHMMLTLPRTANTLVTDVMSEVTHYTYSTYIVAAGTALHGKLRLEAVPFAWHIDWSQSLTARLSHTDRTWEKDKI